MPLLCGGRPVASFMNSAGHCAGDGQIERPDPKVHDKQKSGDKKVGGGERVGHFYRHIRFQEGRHL